MNIIMHVTLAAASLVLGALSTYEGLFAFLFTRGWLTVTFFSLKNTSKERSWRSVTGQVKSLGTRGVGQPMPHRDGWDACRSLLCTVCCFPTSEVLQGSTAQGPRH